MESIEEYDVDISKLWLWKKEVSIMDLEGNELLKVYMRLPGDADINRARISAIRKSAELRKTLKDKENLERYAYIVDQDEITREEMENYILALHSRDFGIEAAKEIDMPLPKKPDDDALLEKQEEYQRTVDEWGIKRMEKISQAVEKKIANFKKDLKNKTDDELYKLYEKKSIEFFCEQAANEHYRNMCVYYSVFKDSNYREKFFKSFDEFDNLPQFVKKQLLEAYNELDLNVEELKK